MSVYKMLFSQKVSLSPMHPAVREW